MKKLFKPTTFLMLLFVILSCGKDDGPKDKEKPRTNLTCVSTYKQGQTIRVNEGVTDNVALKSVIFALTFKGEGGEWEPTETVKVEGKYYDFENVDIFGESIPYEATIGDYLLTVSIYDVSDNVFVKTFDIKIESGDSTKPELTLLTPTDNTTYKWGDKISVTGNGSDDIGLKNIVYSLSYNGSEADPWQPEEKEVILSGKSKTIGNTNVFEQDIPNNSATGEYELSVVLSDLGGNTETIRRVINIESKDLNDPSVNITQPTANKVYKWKEVITFSGTFTDDKDLKKATFSLAYDGSNADAWNPTQANVTLSGTSSTLNNEDVFGVAIPYGSAAGNYILTVVVEDAAGSTSSENVAIKIDADDTVDPTISITSPTSSSHLQWGGSLLVSGSLNDDYKLKSVVYSLVYKGGESNPWKPAAKTISLSGKSVTLSGEDVFGEVIPNNVASGEYELSVKLTDDAGNDKIYKVVFNIGPVDIHNPEVSIVTPTANKVYKWGDKIIVSGIYEDDMDLKEVVYKLIYNGSGSNPWKPNAVTKSIGGVKHTVSDDDVFSTAIPTLSATGDYTLRIIVFDKTEKNTTEDIAIKIESGDSEAPVISITKPTANIVYEWGDNIQVSGTYADDVALKSVVYKVTPSGSSTPAAWFPTKTVQLSGKLVSLSNEGLLPISIPNTAPVGSYTLTITLTDGVGKTDIKTIGFKVEEADLSAPAMIITSPTNGVYINSHFMLKLSGKFTDDKELDRVECVLTPPTMVKQTGMDTDIDNPDIELPQIMIPWRPAKSTFSLTGKSDAITNSVIFNTAMPNVNERFGGMYILTITVYDKAGKSRYQSFNIDIPGGTGGLDPYI